MKFRQNNSIEVAATKASISRATAYRFDKEGRLTLFTMLPTPSVPCGRRCVFEAMHAHCILLG